MKDINEYLERVEKRNSKRTLFNQKYQKSANEGYTIRFSYMLTCIKNIFDEFYANGHDFEPNDIGAYAYFIFKHDGISFEQANKIADMLTPLYPKRSYLHMCSVIVEEIDWGV